MPNINPRINLTLSPEVDAVVSRLAKAAQVGKATVIGQMLAEATPQLIQMATALEQAKKRNTDAFDTMVSAVRSAQEDTAQLEMALKVAKRRAVGRRKK